MKSSSKCVYFIDLIIVLGRGQELLAVKLQRLYYVSRTYEFQFYTTFYCIIGS